MNSAHFQWRLVWRRKSRGCVVASVVESVDGMCPACNPKSAKLLVYLIC